MTDPHDKAQDEARELRAAAGRLRGLLPRFRDAPGAEFVPMSVANLLEAMADGLARDEALLDSVRQRALEIARHVPNTPPEPG